MLQAGALALSLTALALLGVVGPSLLEQWRADLPADTPNWFMINLQPQQRAPMEQRLHALGATNVNLLPLAVGKLMAINGQPPNPEKFTDRRSRSAIEGEVRLSWSDALPPANKLLHGHWFDGQIKRPELSVDQMWVDMFDLHLGDRVGLRFGERDIVATVTSIRGVEWDSFRANFFLMLDPASGAMLPHSVVASFHLQGDTARPLAALSRDYPNVSLIDLNAILEKVRDIIDRVSRAVAWVLGFSLLAGILVLTFITNKLSKKIKLPGLGEFSLYHLLDCAHSWADPRGTESGNLGLSFFITDDCRGRAIGAVESWIATVASRTRICRV